MTENTNTTDTEDTVTADAAREVTPYEYSIAAYIVGVLALQGIIDPRDPALLERNPDTDMPYCAHLVSQALLDGLAAYGAPVDEGIKRLIHCAQIGEQYERQQRQAKGGQS